MELKRYTVRCPTEGSLFADNFTTVEGERYTWYLANNRVGITPGTGEVIKRRFFSNALVEYEIAKARAFYLDFLVTKETLRVRKSPPNITREKKQAGSHDQNEAASRLVELLSSQEQIFAFRTKAKPEDPYPRILTFSTTPPTEDLYLQRPNMPITISYP
ncbi:MAG: hypothetical protein ABIB47_01840 [Candidatus Woesearchaeota archaeon]